jgi:hypothetical protein
VINYASNEAGGCDRFLLFPDSRGTSCPGVGRALKSLGIARLTARGGGDACTWWSKADTASRVGGPRMRRVQALPVRGVARVEMGPTPATSAPTEMVNWRGGLRGGDVARSVGRNVICVGYAA